MLGKYGETLVVDWGLAKVLGHREGLSKSEEGVLRPFSGSGSAPTQMGHVMGTPAYMSPEQAEGRLDDLGPASDIYGLGATLYELLTGREPIQGSHFGEILARVKRGEWLPPRKVRKDVPAPLDAICRKALASRAGDRYTSALDLARDIEHWLADEPVAAYREPWSGRLRRWVRRHRGMAAGTAGLLVAALAALAVGIVIVSQERNYTEEERLRTRQALKEMSSQAIEGWLSRQVGPLEMAQEEFLKKGLTYYRKFAQASRNSEEARSGVAEAHKKVGFFYSKLGRNREAEEAYREAVDQYSQLAHDFPEATEYRQELANCGNDLGKLLMLMGQFPEAERAFHDGLTIQQQLADQFPAVPRYRQELASSLVNLGVLRRETGGRKEAEKAYRDALGLYQQLAAQFPDLPDYRKELAGCHNNLGNVLQETGRNEQAEAAYREALTLYRQLADKYPAIARYHHELARSYNNLGLLLFNTGRSQEAEQSLGDALVLYRRLLAEFPGVPSYRQEFATSYNNLGILFRDTNRPKEAYGPLHDAREIRKQLAGEFSAVPEYRRDLARSHNDMGVLLAVTGRPEEADSAYREAISLQKQLVAKFPNVPDHANDLANTMVNLAELLRDRKDFSQARELLEGARLHHEAALRANPHNPTYRLFFQINRAVLASLLAAVGDHAGARQAALQLAALGWDPAVDAYAAARALAQCARVLANDTQLAEAKRQELVQSYVEQALAMLRQALSKGFKDASQMKKDTYIEPLRSNLEFQRLLKELETQTGRQ
jgi:serine/threonine-protein kinase